MRAAEQVTEHPKLPADALERNADQCKKCQARILWATTPKSKAMPIDFEPAFGGNVVLAVDQVGMLRASSTRPDGSKEAYVAHFVNCPAAAYFRRDEGEASPAPDHDDQLAAKRAALQRTMPFGKYVTHTLEEIDRDRRGHEYLEWLHREFTFRDPSLKRDVALVLGVS